MIHVDKSSFTARCAKAGLAALLLGTTSCFTSCSDEEYSIIDNPVVTEGIPTDVTIVLDNAPSANVTRTALSDRAEQRIFDLVVFVFDRDGKNGKCVTFTNPSDSLCITVPSGMHRVYALANVVNTTDRVTLSRELNTITDVESLKALSTRLEQKSVFRNGGHLIMNCIYQADKPTGVEGGFLVHPANVNTLRLHMKRLTSRINFNVKFRPVAEGEIASFTPTGWRVVNSPITSKLFPEDLTDAAHTEYFSMNEELEFESLTRAADGQTIHSFTFYSMPNTLTGKGANQWADREMMTKDAHGVNTSTFQNAPEKATYVVITGELNREFVDKTGVECRQSALVNYTIHLGNVGNDYNNYECRSNTNYTYTVEVRGVDDIITKVETEDSDDPNTPGGGSSDIGNGEEGEVINARFLYNFDCHYDREILEFSRDYILAHPELKGVYVKTQFDEGAYAESGTTARGFKSFAEAKDYQWLKFRRCDMESDSVYNKSAYSAYNRSDMTASQIITADQLIRELRSGRDANGFAVYDRNGKACYTVFVDENYYTTDPRNGQTAPTDFWKQFVNCPSREFLLLCNPKSSADDRSSVLTAYIQIRQRSIRTVYDTNAGAQLQTAWGVETINETGRLLIPFTNPWRTACSTDNPLANILSEPLEGTKTILDMPWDKLLVNTRKDGIYRNQLATLSEDVSPLLYACIQRNRDLNGDGLISLDEIRWIPAALLQYQELWLGEDALPNETRLYPLGSNEYRRYLSSTGLQIIAEEGANAADYTSREAVALPGQSLSSSYDYRCVRLLGIETYQTDSRPQPLVSVNSSTRYVDLSNLDKGCTRDASSHFAEEQESANADSYQNLPYVRGFYYADVNASDQQYGHLTLNAQLDADGISPCSSLNKGNERGWRLPNESELTIMLSNVADGWNDSDIEPCYYLTRTTASEHLTGKRGSMYVGVSKMVNGQRQRYMTLPATGEVQGRVRCVRDAH